MKIEACSRLPEPVDVSPDLVLAPAAFEPQVSAPADGRETVGMLLVVVPCTWTLAARVHQHAAVGERVDRPAAANSPGTLKGAAPSGSGPRRPG
jgi:hypothetical protein